jgi:hypothetical protein
VEGLLEERVFAKGGLSLKTPTAVGSGEQTHRQGHRVHEREGGVVGSEDKKLLPEVFLELPEVGRLASEGGPMDLAEGREPLAVVTPKEEVDGLESVSSPRNSPTTSMVSTSESENFGAGLRWRIRFPLSRSSTKQKTATMKVLRSTNGRPPFVLDGLEHHRD